METTIIGQGYNLAADTSVAKELIKQFESKRFDSFTCLVAFASGSGIASLTPYISDAKASGMKIRVILGIDQKGTSKEALDAVLNWGIDAYVYHTNSRNIFHPKVYLFENEDIFTLIVGSNNLTVPGLVKNVECSLLIKDIKSNPVHKEFYDYWKAILDGTETSLYPLTRKFIDAVVAGKLVPSDTERAAIHDDKGKDATVKSVAAMFKTVPIQKFPKGFAPRKISVKTKVVASGKKACVPVPQTIPAGEQILIAEIGGGSRWKQVNFPLQIFEDFFGAERGNNNYKIELLNIAKDGTLGDVKESQSVTVKSRNYRFEINCKETQGAYPGNDKRPIGIYVKIGDAAFAYHVLRAGYKRYSAVKKLLYMECKRPSRELRRAIVHPEGLHAVYPELVI